MMMLRSAVFGFFLTVLLPISAMAGEFYGACFESLSGKFTASELDVGCSCADNTLTSIEGDLSDEQISAVIVACFREVVGEDEISKSDMSGASPDVPLDHPIFKAFFDRCMEQFRGETSMKLTNYCECSARIFIEEATDKNIQQMDDKSAAGAVQGIYEKRLRAECSKPE